ncbi:MAG: hypothetical protein BWY79_02201 [Actinobacteria bacterium ADurb.Bin444]|nr:MAG: hypothetical protein BWY79_02201 [Actinobacteria bacterium ADurb.Bin444]
MGLDVLGEPVGGRPEIKALERAGGVEAALVQQGRAEGGHDHVPVLLVVGVGVADRLRLQEEAAAFLHVAGQGLADHFPIGFLLRRQVYGFVPLRSGGEY